MNEQTVKHLELIQGVINRLSQNSFAYKGLSIGLVTAVFALAAKDGNPKYLLDAILPSLAFWALDAYYLRQESLFRALYDEVRRGALDRDPFTMDTAQCEHAVKTWWRTCWSKTIAWLYCPMVILLTIAALVAFTRK